MTPAAETVMYRREPDLILTGGKFVTLDAQERIVTGQSLDAPGMPSQAASVVEALKAYTILGAFSGREEAIKGSLEIGKLADLAVLDRDILSIPAEEIREVRVDKTFVGGDLAYARD